ncbi:hypothetical protein CUPS4066_07330 [Campylobacter upsaliensis]|uniref:hypothetical protein n=1 Tax=Campylobacter upsaliensis TaxID=28080 RepID=UPI00214A7B4B|nr:hypothetical protein [Campylobacter upsaliensis]MCR2108514.1 hypothetical protein [Campylobacter upsaliensis]MCR2122754.1 hypothetical protein [Campylobacter upsaliensis]
MKILIFIMSFCLICFANSIGNMDTHIKDLNELYLKQNIKNNETLALDKDKALSFASLIFLLAKHNELLFNTLKIKGQK